MIEETIRRYVNLDKVGKNLKGICPFCKEGNPSLFVYPEQQSWHCFSCNVGGDSISFSSLIDSRILTNRVK